MYYNVGNNSFTKKNYVIKIFIKCNLNPQVVIFLRKSKYETSLFSYSHNSISNTFVPEYNLQKVLEQCSYYIKENEYLITSHVPPLSCHFTSPEPLCFDVRRQMRLAGNICVKKRNM